MSLAHIVPTFAGLLTAFTLCGCSGKPKGRVESPSKQPLKRAALALRLSGPYTHENLCIFLIHGEDPMQGRKFLTLDEALEQKKVIVHETNEVNQLSVENVSDDEVFIQSGDIVKGGQQDRLIAINLIVPPKSGKVPLDSFCVEAGRWQQRGREEQDNFSSANFVAPQKDLKIAARSARSQRAVWANVTSAQEKLSSNIGANVQAGASKSSLQLTLEHKELMKPVAAYEMALKRCVENKKDVIGLVVTVNGQLNCGDVYASHDLFLKLWPKLLQASAVEAITELQKGKPFEYPTVATATAWLAEAEQGRRSDKAINQRLNEVKKESPKSLLFETMDREQNGACLHRSYIAK